MNKAMKILIVVSLLVAVVIVIGLKETNRQALPEPSSTPSELRGAADPNLPKLIDLGADKCIPCKMMAPILDEIKEEYKGKLDVLFIDVWKNPEEAKKYGINLIPTQIFYDKDGTEVFRHEGFYSREDILKKYNELEIDL